MRILVTGGSGFIGSAVCRFLASEEKAQILNVDKLTYASNQASLKSIASSGCYQFLQADICDISAMTNAFETFRPQAVMHLAAESHVDRSITGADTFLQTNIMGTYALISVARAYWSGLEGNQRNTFRFLHVSTDEVYGSLGEEGLFSEETAYDPSSPYSASKAASDHLVMAWQRTYGFPSLISNCSNNYGPYQFPEKLIPLMILNATAGKSLPIYGSGQQIRDWLHVEDHANALMHILENGRPGEKYNVGGNSERTNLQVVRQICSILDDLVPNGSPRADLIEHVTDRPGHDQRYAIDASKLRDELGWEPSKDFDNGLRETVKWYLDNEAWWKPLQERVYHGERLGLLNSD